MYFWGKGGLLKPVAPFFGPHDFQGASKLLARNKNECESHSTKNTHPVQTGTNRHKPALGCAFLFFGSPFFRTPVLGNSPFPWNSVPFSWGIIVPIPLIPQGWFLGNSLSWGILFFCKFPPSASTAWQGEHNEIFKTMKYGTR